MKSSFTVVPSSGTLPKFNDYFRSLTPLNSDNPWLPEFLQHYTNCTFTDISASRPDCNAPGLIAGLDSDESSDETLVIDSVLTFAYALDSMLRDLCPNGTTGLCPAIESNGTELLLEYLLTTSFMSPANGNVSFLANGDSPGRYSIKNFQQIGENNYTFVTVGKWDESENSETVIKEDVPWYLYDEHPRDNLTGIPKSVCSDPCGIGERRNVNPDNPCCWTCTKCSDYEIVINNGTECQTCLEPENEIYGWPNENFTECVPINPEFRVQEEAWAIAIICFATFGIVVTLFIIGLYVHNQETPLIKASSRELSYIIFAGIMMSYITALLFGVSPSTGVCVMRRLGQPIATSLIYVSLATKTVRLFRIFRASMKTARRPKFISSTFQVVVTLAITGIPIFWTTIFMILEPPQVKIQSPQENTRNLQLTCNLSDAETIGIMVWNIVIVSICCIFAFLTRKLPENYNETRFIAFCAFCTFIVFMTFSPIYFTAREAYYQASYSSLGLIVNASVTLVCLYIVKLYAIYFVDLDEMNIFTQTRMRANTGRLSMAVTQEMTDAYGNANAGFTPEPDDAVRNATNSSSGVPSSPPTHQQGPIPEETVVKETLKAPQNRSRASSNTSVSSRKSVRSTGSVIDRFRVSNKVDVCDKDSGQGDCDDESPPTDHKNMPTDENLNKKVYGNGKVTMVEAHIERD
ncbi:metabotropic glutamate receptor 2-like [Amphiura filiformis]|uniref:metabotropic glutamate receptor 2-like n=1 Tax=Amphiura filiformis TaxID=82378 RepID=UPI003B216259